MKSRILVCSFIFLMSVAAFGGGRGRSCEHTLTSTLHTKNSFRDEIREQQKRALENLWPKRSSWSDRNGPTMRELLEEAGTTPESFYAYKSGRIQISIENALKISRAHRGSIWDVLGFVSNFRSPTAQAFFRIRNPRDTASGSLRVEQSRHLRLLMRMYGRGLDQQDLADILKLRPATVSRIFSGHIPLSLEYAIIIAYTLNVDPKTVLSYIENFDGRHTYGP